MRGPVLLLAVLTSVIALFAQATAAAPRATLRLDADTAPPSLRGAGFQPREHVRVVVVSGATRTVRKVVATRLGRFLVRLRSGMDECAGFSISAFGSMGTKANLKRAPGQCPALAP